MDIKGYKRLLILLAGIIVGLVVAVILVSGSLPSGKGADTASSGNIQATSPVMEAALKTYVPPGKKDEFYLFASGGHSGSVYVIGVPSMRRIRTISVFSPDAATGWGFDKRSKEMMGGFTFGDVHHPSLSETDGKYDGRWLFVNDNANNRAARIDLNSFTVGQITKPIPNIVGPHSAVFVTPNTEYFMLGSRFAAPIPQGNYSPLSNMKTDYKGVLAAEAVDKKTGEMSLAWELLLPPWSYDLSSTGKKISDGWAFLTTYNTEEATHDLEVNASQRDKDYIVAINWRAAEKAAQEGKFTIIGGAKVIDPTKVPGIVYLLPCAKSPHGVDVTPDGRYIVGNGKLSPTVTVFDFQKMMDAIKNNDLQGQEAGLSIINYNKVRVAEIEVGLGPLHTQFDDKGYAYTTLFVDSAIAKWKIGTWKVVDKIQVQYAPGHSCVAGGDTTAPWGKYLVALNKLSKDSYLPVGPSHPESMQLIDISGPKMKLLYDAPIDPEPHYAQMIKADLIHPIKVYPKDASKPDSVWKDEDTKVVRHGDTVEVFMTATRSHFTPDSFEVNQGDRVVIHLTNIEQDEDETHGFGIIGYNQNMEVQPGETKTMEFIADKAGVYPFYCTNFCSALHQEMQGWMLVKPR